MNIKKQDWKRAQIIKSILNFDFNEILEWKNNHFKLKSSSKMLISVSSILRLVNDYNFYSIDQKYLDYLKHHGIEVMRILKECFEKKQEDLSLIIGNLNDKLTVRAILDKVIENSWRIKHVEKIITNGIFVGILDMILELPKENYRNVLVEIKCRNEHTLRKTDLVQVEFYQKMLKGIPAMIWTIDKDNKIVMHNIDKNSRFRTYKNRNTWLSLYLSNLAHILNLETSDLTIYWNGEKKNEHFKSRKIIKESNNN